MKSFLCLSRVCIFVPTTLRQTKMHTLKCGSIHRYYIQLKPKHIHKFTHDKCRLLSRTCSWHMNLQFSVNSAIIWKAKCSYFSALPHPATVLDEVLSVTQNSETTGKMLWEIICIFVRLIKLFLIFLPIILLSPLLYMGHQCRKFWFRVLLLGLETAGPVFVKLGQWASTRRDMFSDEFCQHMAKLQRKRTPHDWNYTSESLVNAFGGNWGNIFVRMDKQPIGSGCCAQVYKAWIKLPETYTGNYLQNRGADSDLVPVAVKVLHPNMDILLRQDLSILKAAASFVTWIFPSLKWLSLVDCVSDFTQLMTAQVDMGVEAKNLEKFSANFAGVESVHFPQPIIELTTPYILVETFEEGEPLENFIIAHSEEKLNVLIADVGLNIFFKMVFDDNFTHGDMHPGNILVQKIESTDSRKLLFWNNTAKFNVRLIILDCGIVSSMDDKGKKGLRDVFSAIVVGDGRRVAELFLNNSIHQCTNKELFKQKMHNIVQNALAKKVNLAQVQVSELLTSLFSTMIEHKVKLDASYSSVMLAIMVLEGLGRSLDPTVDIVEKVKPFLLNIMKI